MPVIPAKSPNEKKRDALIARIEQELLGVVHGNLSKYANAESDDYSPSEKARQQIPFLEDLLGLLDQSAKYRYMQRLLNPEQRALLEFKSDVFVIDGSSHGFRVSKRVPDVDDDDNLEWLGTFKTIHDALRFANQQDSEYRDSVTAQCRVLNTDSNNKTEKEEEEESEYEDDEEEETPQKSEQWVLFCDPKDGKSGARMYFYRYYINHKTKKKIPVWGTDHGRAETFGRNPLTLAVVPDYPNGQGRYKKPQSMLLTEDEDGD